MINNEESLVSVFFHIAGYLLIYFRHFQIMKRKNEYVAGNPADDMKYRTVAVSSIGNTYCSL